MAESTERGASQQVGIILLFGLVVIGATLVVGVGMIALDSIETQASAERGEQAMLQFDNDLQTAMLDNTTGSVYLEEDGEYNLSDGGDIQITAVNEYAERSETISMGTIRYEDGAGNVFAHQAGGVWRGEGENARVVSKPDIRYYEEPNGTDDTNGRLDISIANLSGNVEGGENRVTTRSGSGGDGMDLTRDLGFVNYVKITVSDSPYHNAWADFLREEFDASGGDCNPSGTPTETTICHNEGSEEVTVIAPIEGENPFASHVGIDPTIYGGLYTEGDELTVDSSITVDRYNSSAGWTDDDNVTEDLLVANDGFNLGADANVTGVPVVNGKFESEDDANLSNIAFATEPGGERMDVINGTEVYNVTGSTPARMFGAKMSRPFDEVDGINRETDRAIGLIEEYENTTSGATGTLEAKSDEDGFYYAEGTVNGIDEIDTSNGAVHVAIDGNLDLEGVNIKGNGQAYFYVSGNIETSDVEVDGKRARNLWIYGTSSSEVTVENDFHGVIYAPGSGLTFANTEIYGSVVGGEVDNIDGDLDIHFDKTLRTDIPIPEENRDITVEYGEERVPIDVTFVLDRSGSMGYSTESIEGNDWHYPSYTGQFKLEDESDPLEVGESGDYRTVSSGERGVIKTDEQVRVDGEDEEWCIGIICGTTEPEVDIITNESGSDPLGYRVTASETFVGQLNETDRAGAVEFDTTASRLHEEGLDSDFTAVNQSLVANFGGGTYMKSGIEKANGIYQPDSNSKEVMILLTDGKNEIGSVDDPRQKTLEAANSSPATIYTIGLGGDADEDLLKDIANETGGRYEHVSNAENLSDIFEGIASNVTASSPATFEVASMDEPTTSPNDYSVEVTEQSVKIGRD
ncbi:vWA domain-containing protein [Natrinema sp. LN54]|uniref:vWA domain-containing protein n=1 Tax=Natrinema sp. LN54 TaxID=3458705 RepID=UPI004035217B